MAVKAGNFLNCRARVSHESYKLGECTVVGVVAAGEAAVTACSGCEGYARITDVEPGAHASWVVAPDPAANVLLSADGTVSYQSLEQALQTGASAFLLSRADL